MQTARASSTTREKELLAVPMLTPAGSSQVYSGVARMAGVLWCARHRATPGKRAARAVVVVHPSSNFLGHYALDAWAQQGVDAIAMTTRYIGNDSTLLLENCVLDIAAVVGYLRHVEGYEAIALVGNSGGGGLVALYQEQAEHPSITNSPGGNGPDLTQAELPAVDALVMLMAHPGRALLLTEWLDPALREESDPLDRDPLLDMFEQRNGPPYQDGWLRSYREAQRARNDRITDSVLVKLQQLREGTGERVADLPLVVHATCADPRFLDLTLDESDREPGTLWGHPYAANLLPSTMGHLTSLSSWLSQWSIRTSNGDGVARLRGVSVPVHVIYGTADQGCFPSHARSLYDAVQHDKRRLTPIPGGRHYLNGQPDLTALMASELVGWLEESL